MSDLGNMSDCPIDIALRYLGNKWTFHIIRDLFTGKKSFNEFLDEEHGLYGGVVSKRLKELRDNGIIEKIVSDTFPVSIEYHLTEKGRSLNKVLYELAIFSLKTCPEFKKIPLKAACSSKDFKKFVEALNLKEKIADV